MGRTDIKKQNINKITEEPLTWTEEEIIKKCENMGFLDMEDEDTDVKEKYRKLKRRFNNMLNKNFKHTIEDSPILKYANIYFMPQYRWRGYIKLLEKIFDEYEQMGIITDDTQTIPRTKLKAEINKRLKNDGLKEITRGSGYEMDEYVSIDNICTMLNDSYTFDYGFSKLRENAEKMDSIGETLKQTLIVPKRLTWNNAIDKLFNEDNISRSDIDKMTEMWSISYWKNKIDIDIREYKKNRCNGALLNICAECREIQGTDLNGLRQADQETVREEVLGGIRILDNYINVFKCLKLLNKKGEYILNAVFPDEANVIANLYAKGMKEMPINEEELSKEEINQILKSHERIFDPEMNEFQKKYKDVQKLEGENEKFKVDFYNDIIVWYDRFVYIVNRIILYRRYERMLNSKKPQRLRSVADRKKLQEAFGYLYDHYKPEKQYGIPKEQLN